ncbi:hypothetical protein CIB84_016263 [Bambusicola thoracicus]|uniref:Small nuclear ribonucleoprotein E n=1 Tax=Bambusicola thoracicus TaxID=9083 RepID=A0A2P4S794_BAMTH|nr:hypothetical protein CIB84_016263 [Bambusicola thoracicus]
MAYRGQGQKVQKVMVQPIVSFSGRAGRGGAERGRGLRGGADGARRVGAALRAPGPYRRGVVPVLNAALQNLIFRYLQNRSRIQVWLYEQVNMRIEGCIIGFDEYMNLVLDDAEEIHSKTKSRKQLGRIMLKGDNITLLQSVSN